MKPFEVNEIICFKYKLTGSRHKAKVLEKVHGHEYRIKILESDMPNFTGTEKRIDFGTDYNRKNIEFISVESTEEHFEDHLAKYEAAKYFNCCIEAVNTNDKVWFNESFAQYALWKAKLKETGSGNEELN